MMVSDIQEVSLKNLSNTRRTLNGIGICYFDPVTETLLEFGTDTKIPILPLEESIRRFYVVKDNYSLSYNMVSLSINVSSDEYEVKVLSDEHKDPSKIPNNNLLIDFFSNHPNGIIPFNVYTKSLTTSYGEVDLEIELELT